MFRQLYHLFKQLSRRILGIFAITIGCGALLLIGEENDWAIGPMVWIVSGFFIVLGALSLFKAQYHDSSKPSDTELRKRDLGLSDIWTVLLVLASIVGAYIAAFVFDLNSGIWIVGVGIFIFLIILSSVIQSYFKSQRFRRYLSSLSPDQKYKAWDEYLGGALTRMAEAPEYKRRKEEMQKKLEKRMRPLIDKIENSGKPLSFSAMNQIEVEIKELEKELTQDDTSKNK